MHTDVLRVVVGYLVPADTETTKDTFTQRLRASFSGVFFLPFNLAFVNAGFMLLVLDILELVACTHTEGKYLLAFLTLLLSLTQICQGYVCAIVAFPWAIGRIWLANYHSETGLDPAVVAQVGVLATQTYQHRIELKNSAMFFRLIVELIGLMMVLFYGGATIRYSMIKRSKQRVSAWVLDFALVLGVTKFGLQGMLLGPFLVAIGATVWDALVEAQLADQTTGNTWDDSSLHKSPTCNPPDPWISTDSALKLPGEQGASKRSQPPRDRLLRSPGEPGSVRRLFSPVGGHGSGSADGAGGLQRQGSVVGRPSSRGKLSKPAVEAATDR